MIGRALGAVPAAVWALLPGLVVIGWWLLHEPPSEALQAELDAVNTRLEELAEHRAALDELAGLKRELTIDIELIRELKARTQPLHPSLAELFRILPPDLAIERIAGELPAWSLRLDLLERDRGVVQRLALALLEDPLVESASLVEREGGALGLDLDVVVLP